MFFLHHSLALAFQSQPPVLFGPTLSNESFSPAGFTATAVFDNPISGPPTASGLGEVVEITVGPGVVQVTPIGPLIVSPNCQPPQHATSTSVGCSPSTAVAGQSATCTATVADTAGSGATSPSGTVSFTTGGSGSFGAGAQCTPATATGNSARCSVSYTPTATTANPTRTDTVTAAYGGDSAHTLSQGTTPVAVISPSALARGSFVIGDQNAAVGTAVTFWGARWSALNSLSGGRAPASFKGFASQTPSNPSRCGDVWTSRAGGSAKPPAGVPQYMEVIASSRITKRGSSISGSTRHVVVVKTNPGDAGTGTVIAQAC